MMIPKLDEKQYNKQGAVKPRNIFNPSDSLKAVMGYVMNHAIRALKKDDIISRAFMSG